MQTVLLDNKQLTETMMMTVNYNIKVSGQDSHNAIFVNFIIICFIFILINYFSTLVCFISTIVLLTKVID